MPVACRKGIKCGTESFTFLMFWRSSSPLRLSWWTCPGLAGFDLARHPVFQWVMMAAYSIIILSFLTLIGVILWRGMQEAARTRK